MVHARDHVSPPGSAGRDWVERRRPDPLGLWARLRVPHVPQTVPAAHVAWHVARADPPQHSPRRLASGQQARGPMRMPRAAGRCLPRVLDGRGPRALQRARAPGRVRLQSTARGHGEGGGVLPRGAGAIPAGLHHDSSLAAPPGAHRRPVLGRRPPARRALLAAAARPASPGLVPAVGRWARVPAGVIACVGVHRAAHLARHRLGPRGLAPPPAPTRARAARDAARPGAAPRRTRQAPHAGGAPPGRQRPRAWALPQGLRCGRWQRGPGSGRSCHRRGRLEAWQGAARQHGWRAAGAGLAEPLRWCRHIGAHTRPTMLSSEHACALPTNHDKSSDWSWIPGVECRRIAAWILWWLGYPDQARQQSHEAITLAQERAHPHSLAWALFYAALLHCLCRKGQAAQERAEATIALARQQEVPGMLARRTILRGWVLAEEGQRAEGIVQMRQGLAALQAAGLGLLRPLFLVLLAEVCGHMGQADEGLSILDEARALAQKHGARYYEAELHRVRGELLLMRAMEPHAEAEACFQHALEVARRQQAKSLELRAAMSLSRLWQRQGKRDEARQPLAEVYGWFAEGFDTADLQEAKVLLEDLS